MKNPWKKLSKINPQSNDGNRQINTKILLHLIKADLTASEYKIIFAIIHKTWGFQKQSDAISVGQFMELTSLSKRQIKYIQKELKDRKIVHFEPSKRVHRGSPLNEFLFNKHYDTWCAKRVHSIAPVHSSVKKGALQRQKRVNQSAPTIDTSTKDTRQKKRAVKWPKDFFITEKMKEYAVDHGIDPNKLDLFFEDFHNWAASKGAVYKDWEAAFRTRVNKAQEWGKQFLKKDETDDRFTRIRAKLEADGKLVQENPD